MNLPISGVFQKNATGIEVERKVFPGENITLFCDCSMHVGDHAKLSYIVWFRNCSHIHQPPLELSSISNKYPPHLRLTRNSQNNTYDLVIEYITEDELGLYYCAYMWKTQRALKKAYGTIFTWVTFEGKQTICSYTVP